MNKKSYSIFSYLKEKKNYIFFMITWIFIFYFIFLLYGYNLKHLIYPIFVCISLSCIYFTIDYIRYRIKILKLQQLQDNIDIFPDTIEEATSRIELEYQTLLENLIVNKNKEINHYYHLRKDTIEYITLWAHQIKIPITALQIMADDLEQPVKEQLLKRLFELEEYIDLILQYLKLENNGSDFVFEEYSLKSILNQAIKYYARIFISKKISVNINILDDIKLVTDEKWLVFAIKQLISNALKYTTKGSISFSYSNNTLSITDTGIGITSTDLPRIFDRGYTGYNGRRDKKATGLGLYITKNICDMLSINISIDSQVDIGTTVKLYFKNYSPH